MSTEIGVAAPDFPNTNPVRGEPERVPVGVKDFGRSTNIHLHHREQSNHKVDSDISTNHRVKSSFFSIEDGDGGVAA